MRRVQDVSQGNRDYVRWQTIHLSWCCSILSDLAGDVLINQAIASTLADDASKVIVIRSNSRDEHHVDRTKKPPN
jgi:hypothetical protein